MSSLQEQLNQVPWEQISHAYGPAADTPIHLLALLSDNAEERESALDQLWNSLCIFHQQTVITEASCMAVPFLISILQEVPDEQKPSILRLLSGLADKDESAHQDRMVLEMEHAEGRHRWKSLRQSSWEGKANRDSRWEERVHVMVGDGLPIYLALLRSTHEDTVREALQLLACFHDLNSAIVPIVTERFTETANPYLKASILYCLGELLDAQSPYWEDYYQFVDTNMSQVHPVVRYAAARVLAMNRPGEMLPAVADLLVEEMLQPHTLDETEDTDSEAPREDQGRPTYFLSCRPLSYLGVPIGLQGLISALERGASRWSILDTIRVAEALLDVAFFGCWVENRFWSYRTSNYPFSHIDSLQDAVSTRNPMDPCYGKEIPNLDDDNAFFQLKYARTWTSISEFFIEVSGYDKGEAARLKRRYEQEGSQALLDSQKKALQAVLGCEPLWELQHNLLAIYGLPSEREEIEHFLLKQ